MQKRRTQMTKYKFDDLDKTIQPVPIIITEGKYEGIKFQFGRIAFDEKGDSLALNFDYNLMDNPNELEEDQDFIDALGTVLITVLEDEIDDVGADFLRESEVNEDS
jgi:hypothetical protein